jgi:DNA-binding transcriptional MerR regulator
MNVSQVKRPSSANGKLLKMRELSQLTGVPPGTIRYYINEGLLPRPLKTHRNMAYYDQSYVQRIKLIRELQEKRYLPLSIIGQMLEQSESSMETEEIKTLLDLEGKLFKNISSLPEFQPPDMEELSARTQISVEDIEKLEQSDIVSRGKDGRFDEDCVKMVETMAKLRDAGYTEEAGFTTEHIKMYKDMIEVMAKQEVRMFSRAVTGKMSSEQMTEMAENGVNLMNTVIGLLRKRMILEYSREPDRE